MDITKKCPHCDTALEFTAHGQHLRFTAHDDAFCFAATRERVRMLERVLIEQREAYERRLARLELDTIRDRDAALGRPDHKRLADRIAMASREAVLGDVVEYDLNTGAVTLTRGSERRVF